MAVDRRLSPIGYVALFALIVICGGIAIVALIEGSQLVAVLGVAFSALGGIIVASGNRPDVAGFVDWIRRFAQALNLSFDVSPAPSPEGSPPRTEGVQQGRAPMPPRDS